MLAGARRARGEEHNPGEQAGLGLGGSDTPTAAAALTCSSSGVSSGAMSGRGAVAGSIPPPPPPGQVWWASAAGARSTRALLLRPGASAALGRLAHGASAGRPRRLPKPLLLAAENRLSLPAERKCLLFASLSFPHTTPPLLRRRKCGRGTNSSSRSVCFLGCFFGFFFFFNP